MFISIFEEQNIYFNKICQNKKKIVILFLNDKVLLKLKLFEHINYSILKNYIKCLIWI